VESILRSLNPTAVLVPASYSRVDLAQVMGTGLFQAMGTEMANTNPNNNSGTSTSTSSSNRAFSDTVSGAAAISSFVYTRHNQPFHPGRLHALVRGWQQGSAKRILRAKGFLHVGGRPNGQVFWSLAGNHVVLLQHLDGNAAKRLAKAQSGNNNGSGNKSRSNVGNSTSTSTSSGGNASEFTSEWPSNVGPLHGCTQVVFIGVRLQEPVISAVLDACLMTPAELAAAARNCDAGEVRDASLIVGGHFEGGARKYGRYSIPSIPYYYRCIYLK